VVEVPGLEDLGLCHRDKQLIELNAEATVVTKEIALIHEIVHAILFTMGEDDHDEVSTDALAHMWHQVLTTMKK
jgi:Zn-dependent peptidase ImmA (M78 family)